MNAVPCFGQCGKYLYLTDEMYKKYTETDNKWLVTCRRCKALGKVVPVIEFVEEEDEEENKS